MSMLNEKDVTDEPDDIRETMYVRGLRSAYRELLGVALRGLLCDPAPDDLEMARIRIARLEAQKATTIEALRAICEEHGDNDWGDDLSLADVIGKHLAPYLAEP